MALKPATVGIVLAMALTILTAMASATPIWSPIFGPKAVDQLLPATLDARQGAGGVASLVRHWLQ